MTKPILFVLLIGGAACQRAPTQAASAAPLADASAHDLPQPERTDPEAIASADGCPEIPETPQTDIPECDRAWRVTWCWIGRTEQTDDYQAGFRDGFENYRIDIQDPLPREQVRQTCIDVLDRKRDDAQAEGCWASACVE